MDIQNPSEEIRSLMIKELEKDIASDLFYTPKTIPQTKISEYKKLLKEYFRNKILNELIEELNKSFIDWDYQNIKINSPETLAEGEWNKYYQKAICQIAMNDNKEIKIIRWKNVDKPKFLTGFTESTVFKSKDYYKILSESKFQPLGPNSGLTIEMIE